MWKHAALVLFLSLPLFARQGDSGWCENGGVFPKVSLTLATAPFQASYPGCIVTVYLSGSTTLATIYSDNQGTSKSNPFTATPNGQWQYYADNGVYDVQLSNGTPSFPAPITLGGRQLFDFTTFGPGSPPNSVQFNNGGAFGGSGNFIYSNGIVQINGTGAKSQQLLFVNNNITAGTVYSGYFGSFIPSSTVVGTNFTGDVIGPSSNTGGYLKFSALAYNPYNTGTVCLDQFGNPVQQPTLVPSDSLTNTDIFLWSSTSPLLPSSPTAGCPNPGGAPFPISPLVTVGGVPNQQYGLTTNGYILAEGGLAATISAYNAIDSLLGGVHALTGFVTEAGFNPGPNSTCGALNAVGAGFGGIGFQGGSIYCYWNPTTSSWNNMDLSKIGSGGGGGTPGGATTNVQYNNGGVFGGNSFFTYNQATHVVQIGTPSTFVSGSQDYVVAESGFSADACTLTNCINAPNGGIAAGGVIVTTKNFEMLGTGSSPAAIGAMSYGGIAYKSGTQYWYWNGSSWATVDFSATGSGCTLGGTSTGQIIFNLTGACTSSANLTWNNSTQQAGITSTATNVAGLSVHSGYIETQGGLLQDGVNSWNSIQAVGTGGGCSTSAPCAGVSGLAVFATNYMQLGSYSGTVSTGPTVPGGFPSLVSGSASYNTTSHCLALYDTGTSPNWQCVSGGGGGTPASPSTSVQFNNGGSFGGSSNFVWDNTNQLLTISGISNTAAIATSGTSFIQSGGGFFTASTAINAIHTYGNIQACELSSCSGGNAISVANSTVINSSRAYIGSGGVNVSNTVTGTEILGSNTGTSLTFSNSNANFEVNGNGAVSAAGVGTFNGGVFTNSTAYNSIQTYGGFSASVNNSALSCLYAYGSAGNCLVNTSGVYVGAQGINTSGGATFGSAVSALSGLTTGASSNSQIYIGSGNFYNRLISGSSTAISCSGVANGWTAITTDEYIVICAGGNRFRAAITSF